MRKQIRYSLTKMVNAKLRVGSLRIALESRLIAGWQMIRPVGFRFLNAEQFGTILA
jgi:hypothetical protein